MRDIVVLLYQLPAIVKCALHGAHTLQIMPNHPLFMDISPSDVNFGPASIIILIIIIKMPMFMVLSSWQSHCESSLGSFDECRMAPSSRRPQTKPNDLGFESACRLPESTPTITVYYYYSAL